MRCEPEARFATDARCGLLSSLFFISGLRFLPIAEASATGFVSPLFVTGLAVIFLGEKVGLRRWIATMVGLAGVIIILRPGSGSFILGAVPDCLGAGLGCDPGHDADDERKGTRHQHHDVFGDNGSMPAFCAGSFRLGRADWARYSGVFSSAFASTAGQWIVVLAFRYADASVLAPFSYVQLLWVGLLGFVIFGEVPDIWTVTGAALIVGSGLYTAHRERLRRSQLLQLDDGFSPNA